MRSPSMKRMGFCGGSSSCTSSSCRDAGWRRGLQHPFRTISKKRHGEDRQRHRDRRRDRRSSRNVPVRRKTADGWLCETQLSIHIICRAAHEAEPHVPYRHTVQKYSALESVPKRKPRVSRTSNKPATEANLTDANDDQLHNAASLSLVYGD